MTHLVQDLNRRNLSFSQSKVREVLPEYFVESYPNIVTFLEKYYDYLESINDDSFKRQINQLFVLRDPDQVDLDKLDYILQEVGNGLKSSSFFDNPRLMTSLLTNFYQVKGTRSSIEGFFRGFFGQEITVEYPKRNIFVVGESEIGYESEKFVQDNALYQIFSILIKSGLSTSTYNDLYLKFVHPAGFYFAGEVELEGNKAFGITPFTESQLRDSAGIVVYSSQASFGSGTGFAQLTRLRQVGDSNYRSNLNLLVSAYQDIPVEELSIYGSFTELLDTNSFTFDNSNNTIITFEGTHINVGPDFSMTLKTMDNDMYTRYTSDSAY